MWLITVLSWFNRRGQYIFHVGWFGQLFSLNKWNHHLKTAFCIYSGYLCVILYLFDDLNLLSVTNMHKKTHTKNKLFHTTVLCKLCFIYIFWMQLIANNCLTALHLTCFVLHFLWLNVLLYVCFIIIYICVQVSWVPVAEWCWPITQR